MNIVFLPIVNVWDIKPIELISSAVALAGTEMVNLPFAPVETPNLAPTTFTVTPGIGRPSSLEVTVPVIVLSCANAEVATNNKMNKLRNSFFIKLII